MADRVALEIAGVSMRYASTQALNSVSITVPAGTLFALCGPNGAGKSTLLRHCTGLLRPDAGRILVDGIDVWADGAGAKRRFGYVPDDPTLFPYLTGRQMLEYIGLLHELDAQTVRKRSGELIDVLGLADHADQLQRTHSLGTIKRVALACSLIHSPSVLFVDELFGAIDPISTNAIEVMLRAFVGRGGTVVFASHVMDVVERLCDSIAILHEGRVAFVGSLGDAMQGRPLRDAFVDIVGGRRADTQQELSWLAPSSD